MTKTRTNRGTYNKTCVFVGVECASCYTSTSDRTCVEGRGGESEEGRGGVGRGAHGGEAAGRRLKRGAACWAGAACWEWGLRKVHAQLAVRSGTFDADEDA